MLGYQRGLLGLILFRHLLGVAAGSLRVLEFLVFDGEEFCAKAFHLLLGRRPNVGRGDDGAKAACGRDRLQAGNADTHDEYLGRRHRAGRGHHHRQRAAIFLGGVDHGAIAGKIGLARQHVHRLRAGDARHQLHGESDNAGIGDLFERRIVAVRVHDAKDQCALFHPRQFAGGRPPHLKHDVGIVERIGGHRCAGGGIIAIEHAGLHAGARHDGHLGAEADHFLHCVRNCGNAGFAIGLGSNRNLHRASNGC